MAKRSSQLTLAEARTKAALSPDVARHLVAPPIGRNAMYGMIERGEVRHLRIGGNADGRGGRILIPTAPFLALFGLETMECSGDGAQNEPAPVVPIIGSDRVKGRQS